MMVDGYPLWTKLDSPVALALHIFTLQQEGIDTSNFRYEDLPDCPPDMVPMKKEKKKNKKKKTEGDESKQKQPKKPKSAKVSSLSTYSEPVRKGTSDISTSGISISGVNTTQLSSTSQPTKPSSISSTSQTTKSTQAQTSFVSNSETTSFTYLNSESNSETSSESPFQDPPSPSTENLSKLKISTSAPINTLPLVLNQIDSDTPMSEPTSLNNSGSEPNTSEIPMSEPLISELTTQPIPLSHFDNYGNEVPISSAHATTNIPVVYLDISDDEILISDAIPTVTSPSDPPPQTELVPFQFIPNNLEECINMFGYDTLKRIHEYRTSACPHPVLVKRVFR